MYRPGLAGGLSQAHSLPWGARGQGAEAPDHATVPQPREKLCPGLGPGPQREALGGKGCWVLGAEACGSWDSLCGGVEGKELVRVGEWVGAGAEGWMTKGLEGPPMEGSASPAGAAGPGAFSVVASEKRSLSSALFYTLC